MPSNYSRCRWFVLGALMTGSLLVSGLSAAHAAEPILVMSYNIRYANPQDGEDVWVHRRDTVAKTLEAADVIGLQEVLFGQLDDVRKRLPDFEWYGAGRDDGVDKGEMSPIGFRKDRFECLDKGTFWLSESPQTVGKPGWDAMLPRVVSWARLKDRASMTQFLFANTHFDHRGRQARAESGKQLRAWLGEHRGDMAAVLTGDFNAVVDSEPMKNLLAEDRPGAGPLLKLARDISAVADSGPVGTFNGFKQIEGSRRIDHILVSGPVKVEQFKTLDPRTPSGRFASDHLPIQAKLSITNAAK